MRRVCVMLLVNDLRPGGAEQRALDLARCLDKQSFRVLLTTLRPGESLEDELRAVRGVELHTLGQRWAHNPFAAQALASLLRKEQVDVLHPFMAPATSIGMSAAILARTPVRVVPADEEEVPGSAVYRVLERRLARFASAITPSTEGALRSAAGRGVSRDKMRLIYDGVAPERIRTNPDERTALRHELGVLDESWVIGTVVEQTEMDYGAFLQAASIIRAEVPGTRFMIVGDGPVRSDIQRRATLLGLDGSVIFAGHQARLAQYIGAMDIAVVAPADGHRASGFALQAMALGRPLVATDAGGREELFKNGEAGLLVPPHNPLILAHAVLELIRHPDAVERMRERGREIFRERYTLPRMVRAYEDLYTDLYRRYEERRASRGSAAETVGER
jgi:glycosyltransferase involved in cell wall biosynthesis